MEDPWKRITSCKHSHQSSRSMLRIARRQDREALDHVRQQGCIVRSSGKSSCPHIDITKLHPSFFHSTSDMAPRTFDVSTCGRLQWLLYPRPRALLACKPSFRATSSTISPQPAPKWTTTKSKDPSPLRNKPRHEPLPESSRNLLTMGHPVHRPASPYTDPKVKGPRSQLLSSDKSQNLLKSMLSSSVRFQSEPTLTATIVIATSTVNRTSLHPGGVQ